MQNKRVKCESLLFMIILCFMLISSPAIASPKLINGDNCQDQHNKITRVKTGIYIADISHFDLSEGNYEVDFYLNLICQPNCSNLNFQLVNGKTLSKEVFYNSKNWKLYRIDAILNRPFDFKQYPFDSHRLSIVIEDKYLDTNKLIFIFNPDKTDISKSTELLGWKGSPIWKAEVINYAYPIYHSTSSRFILTLQVSRPILAGILKIILPSIFIMTIGLLALFVDSKQIFNGLSLACSALVSMVLLHINSLSSLPANHYMTFIDGFMLVNYVVFLIVFSEMIILMHLPPQRIKKLERKFLYSTSIIWLILQVINWLFFFI